MRRIIIIASVVCVLAMGIFIINRIQSRESDGTGTERTTFEVGTEVSP